MWFVWMAGGWGFVLVWNQQCVSVPLGLLRHVLWWCEVIVSAVARMNLHCPYHQRLRLLMTKHESR